MEWSLKNPDFLNKTKCFNLNSTSTSTRLKKKTQFEFWKGWSKSQKNWVTLKLNSAWHGHWRTVTFQLPFWASADCPKWRKISRPSSCLTSGLKNWRKESEPSLITKLSLRSISILGLQVSWEEIFHWFVLLINKNDLLSKHILF